MEFDPEAFGQAMGESIRRAVEPLQARIADLEKQVASLPAPINGQDGAPGKDGKSITIEDVQPIIDRAVALICEDAEQAINEAVKAIPAPKDGKDGRDGERGEKGEKGADGAGIADALIDRDGALVVTYTDGRVKSLGQVVGRDGRDGEDGRNGADGIGLESFELEYLPETHEISVRAAAAGRTKEIRYPAGGIRPAGYWREGTKAKSGEAWVHDGSGWVALRDTASKPESKSADWILMARRGRDGERGLKGGSGAPDAPVKLGPSDD